MGINRNKTIRVLTLPIFVCGIFWWHIRKAFDTGYDWEKIEMEKINKGAE